MNSKYVKELWHKIYGLCINEAYRQSFCKYFICKYQVIFWSMINKRYIGVQILTTYLSIVKKWLSLCAQAIQN